MLIIVDQSNLIFISRFSFFGSATPFTVSKYGNNLSIITYTTAEGTEEGRAYHVYGTLKDVIQAMRQVEATYQYIPKYHKGEVELLTNVDRMNNEYVGRIIVRRSHGDSSSLESMMKSTSSSPSSSSSSSLDEKKTSHVQLEHQRREKEEKEEEEKQRVHEAMLVAARMERQQRQIHGYNNPSKQSPIEIEKEHDQYHGTGISPAEREERDQYHGTGIAPVEQKDEFKQTTSWEHNSFDIHQYIGDKDDHDLRYGMQEGMDTYPRGRYMSHVERQRLERRNQHQRMPERQRTWDDIRRQSS